MKNKIYLIISISLLTFSLSARQGNDMILKTGYILPLTATGFNSSLVLGLGTEFWGIFEFSVNAYLEIDNSKVVFIEKFQRPNVFSAGMGMNIPMGGFCLKSDYQRFFAIDTNINELSISNFTNSYKYGIGIKLDRDVELEVYERTLTNDSFNIYERDEQSLIGIGLNIKL